ncbi:MAG: hypothetical protein HY020_01755 [Burkholderiales bacterium]|nr:hypothetical protein [Burkholderiales bacterium]
MTTFLHRPALRAICLACLGFVASGLRAATLTWDGGGASDNWSDTSVFGDTNWVAPPKSGRLLHDGDYIVFTGARRLANINDYTDLQLGGISFDAAAGGFSLQGKAVVLQSGLFNRSAAAQSVSFDMLSARGNQTWQSVAGLLKVGNFGVDMGTLTLGGPMEIGGDGALVVGKLSNAALIARGAQKITSTAAQVGLVAHGAVQLDSAAARWTTGTLAIGSSGSLGAYGEVQVTGGAFLDVTNSVTIGWFNPSLLTAQGGLVRVGGNVLLQAGSLNLSDGAQLAARVLSAAPLSGNVPGIGQQISVSGQGTRLTVNGMELKDGGSAYISHLARVDVQKDLSVGTGYRTSFGSVLSLSDYARLNVLGAATIGSDVQSARVTVSSNAVLDAQDLNVGAKGTLSLAGGALFVHHGFSNAGVFDWQSGRLDLPALNVAPGAALGEALRVPGAGLLSVNGDLQVGGIQSDGLASSLIVDPGARVTTAKTTWIGSAGPASVTLGAGASLVSLNLALGGYGQLTLDGGTLDVRRDLNISGGRFDWRSGQLKLASLDVSPGGVLGPVLRLPGGGSVLSAGLLNVGLGGVLLYDGDSALRSTSMTLAGGTLVAPRLDLDQVQRLQGQGVVSARISGHAGSSIGVATGTLTAGLASAADGFDVGGDVGVKGGATLILLDADLADLRGNVALEDNARLAALNGLHLAAGGKFGVTQGEGRVQGLFVNDGRAGAQAGATLRFLDEVSGSGSFSGQLVFSRGFTPGGSATAYIDFGAGALTLDPGSQLELDVADASHFDHLGGIGHLSMNGRVTLRFGASFAQAAAGGLRLGLLDFASLSGGLDAAHVDVVGFDRSRLDFSRLAADGSLGVSAVPEPASWMLGLVGGALFVARRRWHRAAD